MAVVRVELDIDGDVYPELYATLAALRVPMLRDERMRQLASMGLAWEAVRLLGPAAGQLPARSAMPLPASPVSAPAPASRSVSRTAAKGSPRKTTGRSGSSDQPQLPVLVDIVAQASVETAPSDLPAVDDGPVTPIDPMPIHAANRGSGSRTRLQRMKDRGLFKNG